jgi:hypothetical protein
MCLHVLGKEPVTCRSQLYIKHSEIRQQETHRPFDIYVRHGCVQHCYRSKQGKNYFVYSTVHLQTLINPLKQFISTKRKTSVPASQKTHPVTDIHTSQLTQRRGIIIRLPQGKSSRYPLKWTLGASQSRNSYGTSVVQSAPTQKYTLWQKLVVSWRARKNCGKRLLSSCPSVRPSVPLSVCLSVRTEQFSLHSTDYHETLYWKTFRKYFGKNEVSLKSDKNNRYFT